jgi:hypothetical protein
MWKLEFYIYFFQEKGSTPMEYVYFNGIATHMFFKLILCYLSTRCFLIQAYYSVSQHIGQLIKLPPCIFIKFATFLNLDAPFEHSLSYHGSFCFIHENLHFLSLKLIVSSTFTSPNYVRIYLISYYFWSCRSFVWFYLAFLHQSAVLFVYLLRTSPLTYWITKLWSVPYSANLKDRI